MAAVAATAERSDTAERILDAVVAVLARNGIGGTSMRAVAQEAGVAVGLANYHFRNKTELIAAALVRIGETDLELVTPRAGEDPPAQLRWSLRRAFDPAFLTPEYLSLRLQLWSLAGVEARYAEINRKAQQRYLDGLVDLVAAARPELAADDVATRAGDILVVQNGVWLTSVLIADSDAVVRSLARCEQLAFG